MIYGQNFYMKKISLLFPVFNEEHTLPLLYDRVKAMILNVLYGRGYECEVLFVNDGSKDKTRSILEKLHQSDPNINYLNLSRNFGKENAMLAGFDYVTGDCCIVMDADLQDPVELIPEMIRYWEDGYDDVYGKRRDRGKESWLRKKLSLAYYYILQRTTSIEVLPNVGDFRLLDRRCIEALKKLRETQRYTKGLFCWIGYNKKEIEFDRADSAREKSSFNFIKLFNLAIEGITSFTIAPLRFASIIGFLVSFCSFCYLIWVFVKTIIWGDPIQGFPTLMCVILMLGGIQLLALGIIGEYIGRIFNETKNRPVYIVESFNGKKL